MELPYAAEQADRDPPVAVRLRRDFGQVFALIRARAILHQASRERDEEQRIVTTLEDYALVRELVVDVIAEGAEATLRDDVLPELGLTVTDAAKQLGATRVALSCVLKGQSTDLPGRKPAARRSRERTCRAGLQVLARKPWQESR